MRCQAIINEGQIAQGSGLAFLFEGKGAIIMKKNCIIFVSIFMLLLNLSSIASSFDLDFDASIMLTDTADADTYPSIDTNGRGIWIVAWHSSEGSSLNDTDIFISRSTDDGNSWMTPVALNNNATIDSVRDFIPSIVTDGNGNWVAVWHTTTGWRIMRAFSNDEGVTWSDPSSIGIYGRNAFAKVTTDKAGKWIAVWYAQDGYHGTDWDIFYAISSDNGVSWSSNGPLNQNASTDLRDDADPTTATDGLGTWITVWRSTIEVEGILEDNILLARSTNYGETWSEPIILNTLPTSSGRNFAPELTTDGVGNWVVVWYSPYSDILMVRSVDNGNTWTNPSSIVGVGDEPDVATDLKGHWTTIAGDTCSGSSDNGNTWNYAGITGAGGSRSQIATDRTGLWIATSLGQGSNFYRQIISVSKASLILPSIQINIDIKPGSHTNSINPRSKGKIPVAIISTMDFNAQTEVDTESLTFGSNGDEKSLAFCKRRQKDVNVNGYYDLICHFYT